VLASEGELGLEVEAEAEEEEEEEEAVLLTGLSLLGRRE
jgi:hypothetical protein